MGDFGKKWMIDSNSDSHVFVNFPDHIYYAFGKAFWLGNFIVIM